MGKIIRWIEAVIANNNKYAPMAGVDIKKSADRLFEDEKADKDEKSSEKEENKK